MQSNRRKFNQIRKDLDAVTPIRSTDKLPPQPSILPAILPSGDSILVRGARKLDRLSNTYPKVKNTLLIWRPRRIKQNYYNDPKNKVKKIVFTRPEQVKVSIVIPVFNKFDLTMQCLESLLKTVPKSNNYEVIVVDNGSKDKTHLLSKMKGLKYIKSETNLGFVKGCNLGASKAGGDYLVFLNNDTLVTEGWLESLVDTLQTYPDAGLVGSKILYLDGRLQEAGGIIFKDGTGENYGKNDHPDRYQYNYVREVDYCSGASIIVKRSLFEKLNGFDVLYQPAYYEDTDLAFRIRELGLKVVYQPKSVVYHIEGATSGTDTSSGFKKYQVINHKKFVTRWGKLLKSEQYTKEDAYKGRDRSSTKLALIADEHTPTPDQDAGSMRMVAIIKLLKELGYKVTFFPVYTKHRGKYTEILEQQGVEVIYGDVRLEDLLEKNGKFYDLVMLSRPRVGSFYMDLCQAYCDNAKIIYDTVDLHYLRLRRQAEYESTDLKKYYTEMSLKHKELEHRLMKEADNALVVSEVEQKLLKEEGLSNVSVLSVIHTIKSKAYEVGFDERTDLIFIGGYKHLPNVDAITWFVDNIFPEILKRNKAIKLHVVGADMPKDLIKNLMNRPGIILDGYVEDLTPLLSGCRVFVAPLRYGAGVKGKIAQAMEYGIPVVTTTIGAEGMYMKSGESCIAADTPKGFADGVLSLYSDKALWEKIQKNAKNIIDDHFSVEHAKEDLESILS